MTPEPISIARCRELLKDEADGLSDEEVQVIRRHADAMARVLIAVFLENQPAVGYPRCLPQVP